MHLTLCFDFGNTILKCAVFKNEALQEVFSLTDASVSSIESILTTYHPQKTILSSVINHNPEIEELLSANTIYHKLTNASKLPFTTPVNVPETIGADRLALCAAAVKMFPQQHNLVISLGSCITYNFINKFREFLGGSISPGMQMRFKAMHQFTAKLPLIKADTNFPLIGYNTTTNLLSGVIIGMRKEIDGITDEYAKRYSNFNVHLTGGDMPFFAPHLKNKIFANPYLLYNGLYAINEINS